MRPALDGHAGIPQETRLLFRGLASMDGVDLLGLIQSSSLSIEPGLPLRAGEIDDSLPADERIDRLSKVVVSLHKSSRVSLRTILRPAR